MGSLMHVKSESCSNDYLNKFPIQSSLMLFLLQSIIVTKEILGFVITLFFREKNN